MLRSKFDKNAGEKKEHNNNDNDNVIFTETAFKKNLQWGIFKEKTKAMIFFIEE